MTQYEFFEKVRKTGGRAYLVGGAVRDMLLGKEPHDKDYVVCGVTEQQFASAFSPIRVGKSFPVFLIEIDNTMCEVAFARREIKFGHGYKGFKVDFAPTTTIEDDLYRRDLTINAIAQDEDGNLIDPYNGAEDIRNRIIRAVSYHFSEDPVRALRAARLAAQLGFKIEENTLAAMRYCAEELRQEPSERKLLELKKALESNQPSLYFRSLLEADLLKQEYPWIYNLIGQTQPAEHHPEGDAFEHTMQIVDRVSEETSSVEARFAALMHDIGKGLTPKDLLPKHHGHDKAGLDLLPEIVEKLKIPNKWAKSAALVIKEHMRVKKLTGYGKMRDILYEMYRGPLSPDDFAAIIIADSKSLRIPFIEEHKRCWEAIREAGKRTASESHLCRQDLGKCIRSREAEALKAELRQIEREGTGLVQDGLEI